MPATVPQWIPSTVTDNDNDSSDKTFTADVGRYWQIINIRVDYTTNATVGERQLEIRFLDQFGQIFHEYLPNRTQAASINYTYNIGNLAFETAELRDSRYLYGKPNLVLLNAGWTIRILDNNAVDAAGSGEDMHVTIYYLDRRLEGCTESI